VALLIGKPETADAPLCRLHSECLTGDLFGSLRCDCGEQLNGAIARMAEEGAGVLLYLRQEGRGIGLVNKLRAYRLQDQGLDTVDANTHLGFQPDERDFAIAATMLQRLGFDHVRLLTNNPDKVQALGRNGVIVDERVALSFAPNNHNRFYLETKARKSGHLLRVIDGGKVNGWSDRRDPLARTLNASGSRELGA
jgi:GTP cyclohydrolase II